jgi:hypothetical protein
MVLQQGKSTKRWQIIRKNFPEGYIIELTAEEKQEVFKKF